MSKAFGTWLDTFIEEKGLDLEGSFTVKIPNQVHIMPYGVVVEAMKGAPDHEQKKIKDMLVIIDFKNRDVKHYLRHLAQALALNYEASHV